MPLLQPIGIVDVFALTHSLYARQKILGPPKAGVRYLVIDEAVVEEWQILKSFLAKLERLLEERSLDWHRTAAALRWLDPGVSLPWSPGIEGEIELHIGIVTHPLSRLYAGPEIYSLGWGEMVLSAVGPRLMRSDVNSSELRAVSLILTLKKTQADAGETA
jgi:hypothetical protein